MRKPELLIGCPDWQTLFDFDSGRLTDPESEVVAGHLPACVRCQDTLRELQQRPSEGGLGARLRQCLRERPLGSGGLMSTVSVGEPIVDIDGDGHAATGGRASVLEATVGKRVGPYAILSVIGRGGMGVVYRAVQEQLNRTVALKMIRDGASAHADVLRRFRTEGEAVARLQHPNIVQIYDFDHCAGVPYFAMELVNGGSLARRLAGGPLPIREAAELVRTLAAALDYAHRRQVLHRDLKPGNILLADDGTPKVADFGLAKLLDESCDGLTVADAVLGTPSYMAPEQAAGRTGEIGPRTDVYALGAILYEALVGRPPFVGRTKQDTIRLVRETDPPLPTGGRQSIPRDLVAICMKCLEKSPTGRYFSAQALADDLGRWLRGERPKHTPGRLGRAVKALRRWKWCVGGGLVILPLLAAAYYRNPDRLLREMQDDLARGRTVTLIDHFGRAKWLQWRTGKEGSTRSEAGGAFTIDCRWTVAVVELLPDPRTDRYRFACQVQHSKSGTLGEVGVYVARRAYPGGAENVHFFTQLSYNDVKRVRDMPLVVDGRRIPRHENTVELKPHLHSEYGRPPNIDCRMSGQAGPEFRPAEEDAGGWHELEVTVDRAGVTAAWDGRPFGMSTEQIRGQVATEMVGLRARYPDDLFVHALQPEVTPRGGLGLYVMMGTASFRNATVTPLADND